MADLDVRGSFVRLVALARPQLGLLAVATVSLFVASGLSLSFPKAIGWLVDEVLSEGKAARLNQIALLLVGVFVFQAIFSMLRSWLFTVAGERIVSQLRKDLFKSIMGQDTAFFDTSRTGELTNRLAADTAVLQNTVSVNISMLLRYTLGTIGGGCILFWMSPRLTVVACTVVPMVAVGASVYGRVVRRLSRAVQDALADASSVAEESLQGVRTVRSFARESFEIERYGEAVERSYRLAAKRALALGVFQGGISFAGYTSIGLVVWYGGSMVLDGELTAGALTSFILYTLMVAVSLGALSGLYGDFMKAVGASTRVFELLDQRPTLEWSGERLLDPIRGAVRFEGVCFSYPSRPDVPVFSDLNLEMEPGSSMALVGSSGAGKSTVASLLLRFYDPDAGVIWIDETPLNQLSPRPYRERVGMVAQEPILFATSVEENIRYGRQDATMDEIRSAARSANALDFIDAFPDGFQTLVGERGVRLSGGQKQRIAIARAVLKDPALLILDEATSALDAESEHLVQEALERLMKGRTTLIIAHRLSTVRNADQVAVIDGGRVAELGTHEQLVQQDGLYRALVRRQFASGAAGQDVSSE